MSSAKKAVAHLSSDLQLFAPQISSELQELRRNVEVRPVTGATLYRRCLEDLDDRVSSLGEEVAGLEAVSLDAISLEELMGHCVTLYQANFNAISALEAGLQSYGYREVYSPLPPSNPLEYDCTYSPHCISSEVDGASEDLSPPTIPPSLSRYAVSDVAGCSAAQAMAPMTAAKMRVRDDTPSSLSSPETLSPSMRHLMGKYALGSGASMVTLVSRSARKGAAPQASISPVPPLSPAFASAAEQHRLQIEKQREPSPVAETPLPLSTPIDSAGRDVEVDEQQLHAANAFIAATAQKLATDPALMDSYRSKYPYIAASAERLVGAGEEESTMELKAQVIFNRALAHQQQLTATPNGVTTLPPELGVTPSTAHLMKLALGMGGVNPSSERDSQSREGLQDAIAKALGRVTTAASAVPTPATTTPAVSSTVLTARTLPSARSGQPSLTPSLPTAVPLYAEVDANEYLTLPSFIRGQLPLEALNEAASAVHAVATRRCAAGEGTSFSMDDVEAAGALPVGKGKVLVNALAKLGRVQLKVLYGQGTVYFFSTKASSS